MPLKGPAAEFNVKVALSEIRSFGELSSLLSSRKLPAPLMVKEVALPRRALAPLSWKRPELTMTEPVNTLVLVWPL